MCSSFPAAGCTTSPAGLFNTSRRFVLKENIERNVLRLRLGGSGFGPHDVHDFARARRVRGFGGLTVDGDVALLDQPLNGPARCGRELPAQKRIEPLAGMGVLDGKGLCARIHQGSILGK